MSFNPSESMDLVGSPKALRTLVEDMGFQSFWVNGFGWKDLGLRRYKDTTYVSILLGQWIWLEVLH